MPFPDQGAGVGRSLPFRKLTLDVDEVETALPWSAVYERQTMRNGAPRLLIAIDAPNLFRTLVSMLDAPLFVLYILHTSRGVGVEGRYQSPPLECEDVDDFLATFTLFLAGDARHDLWVHSPEQRRTLIWDRHDVIYAEGESLDNIESALVARGYNSGPVLRPGVGAHVHYYRTEFDADAAAVLARFDWTRTDLRPEDEQ